MTDTTNQCPDAVWGHDINGKKGALCPHKHCPYVSVKKDEFDCPVFMRFA
jgi:hypothetical protein